MEVIGMLFQNSICSTNFLKEFQVLTTKSLKNFQDNDGPYPDAENMFDEMLKQKLELMRDMFWEYEWWVFKTRWKIQTIQKAEIRSLSSFVFQYLTEMGVAWASNKTMGLLSGSNAWSRDSHEGMALMMTLYYVKNLILLKHKWRWKLKGLNLHKCKLKECYVCVWVQKIKEEERKVQWVRV
jgi:hypothetical protein